MKINYDPEIDAIYIEFRNISAFKNIDIEEGVSIDLDKNGHLVGIEILDAQDKLKDDLLKFEFNQIPMRRVKKKTAV